MLVWRRHIKRWPFLFTALTAELLADVAGMLLIGHGTYHAYFYTYWTAQGVQSLLRLFVIGDIIRSFPGIDILTPKIYIFVGTAGATMAIASAAYCFHASSSTAHSMLASALLMNRCSNIAWVSFIIAALGSIKLLNLGWDPFGARVANAYFLRVCAGMVVGELIAQRSIKMRLFANGLDSFVSIAAFSFWAALIIREKIVGEAHGDVETLNGTPNPA